MKSATVLVLASISLVTASLAGVCQNDAKKDTDKTETTTASASILISKSTSGKAFGSHLEPILKTVSASDDQRKSITAIVDDFKVRIVPLRKRHDELREQFFKSLTSGESGETVLATQSEFIRAQSDLNAQYLAMRLKIQQVLTPAQNEKFKDYRMKQGWKSK